MRPIGWCGAEAAGVIVLALYAGAAQARQAGPVRDVAQQVAQQRPGESAPDAAVADEVVKTASERYAAAAYADALAILDAARPAASDIVTRSGIEQYRALCLLALGRKDDAEQAIERLVTIDPRYDVGRLDVSPSIKGLFQTVRRRVLPAIARAEYESGKAAFERQSYSEAAGHLRQALAASSDVGDSADPAVKDVRTLGQGFLDLATQALAASAKPPPASAPVAPPLPPKVVDPVALRQALPALSWQWRQVVIGREGVVELTVDETGRVTTAVMRKPINGVYDALLLEAVKTWRYRPGTIDGRPVRRTVTVVVRPE